MNLVDELEFETFVSEEGCPVGVVKNTSPPISLLDGILIGMLVIVGVLRLPYVGANNLHIEHCLSFSCLSFSIVCRSALPVVRLSVVQVSVVHLAT